MKINDEFVLEKTSLIAKSTDMATAIKMAAGMIRAKQSASDGIVLGSDSVQAMLTPQNIVLNAAKNASAAIESDTRNIIINNYSKAEVSTDISGKDILITIR